MPSDPSPKEYTIERLSAENLISLDELYHAVYGRPAAAGFFQKKYDTGYTGVTFLGYIAFNTQGIAVAYYGVMPCLIQYDKRLILAAQSGDTMTHPGHRYKGMFVELSMLTFELCRSAGVSLLFGFPNQNSYHGAVTKLGWAMTGTMECFIVPVRTLPLAAAANRLKWLQPLYRSWSRHLLKDRTPGLPGVPNSVLADGFNGICRDDRYLAYKTYSDTQVIRIGRASAWVKVTTDLIIGDLALEGADFGTTLAAIERTAMLLGLKRLLFHASPGTSLHRMFSQRYPGIASFPILFQDLGSGLNFDNIKFTFADIDIF